MSKTRGRPSIEASVMRAFEAGGDFTVDELVEDLGHEPETIRTWLTFLEANGTIEQVDRRISRVPSLSNQKRNARCWRLTRRVRTSIRIGDRVVTPTGAVAVVASIEDGRACCVYQQQDGTVDLKVELLRRVVKGETPAPVRVRG